MVLCVSVITGCKKDKGLEGPALKETTKRTVLMYLFQDTNLSDPLTDNINELEMGWVPGTNGTMLVYVDPSTRMTQFDGKPVLLEITHDTTNLIVSKIAKVYEDANATDPDIFYKIQQDAAAMYPAESYGLIIAGHGDGFFVNKDDKEKGLGNSDRWNNRKLNIDDMADNLPVYYDFIIFDACLMGETSTLYQLRDGTDFVVASAELSPGEGFAYISDLKSLFTYPNADLHTFVKATANRFQQNTYEPDNSYTTTGVYRMAAMENLAVVTNKVMARLGLKYNELYDELKYITEIRKYMITNSMYYPCEDVITPNSLYYDMGLLRLLLIEKNHYDLAKEFEKALYDVVMQSRYSFSKTFLYYNGGYDKLAANLSFYIPKTAPEMKFQNNAFYKRFEWSAAAGFSSNLE